MRLEQDDVELGEELEGEGDEGGEGETDAGGNHLVRRGMGNGQSTKKEVTAYLDIWAKPDGQVGQPDHTGGVAGESNKLGLIEIFWNISGIKSINMAEDDSA